MSTASSIEWTDTTWNPVVGCTMISPGCARCYAERMSNRLRGMAIKDQKDKKNPGRKAHYLSVINKDGRWTGGIELVPEALSDPFSWRKSRRVFVNSMSDLFHKDVPFDFVDRVFAVMALCPQHTFQVLTKRPERMAEYTMSRGVGTSAMSDPIRVSINRDFTGVGDHRGALCTPLFNVWLGTSVEDQQCAEERMPHLRRCLAGVRFLSVEPMLGPVDLASYIGDRECCNCGRKFIEAASGQRPCPHCYAESDSDIYGVRSDIHWVIVGGESGHDAREFDVLWAESIVDQCRAAGVPCFVKQLGARPMLGDSGDPHGWPESAGPVNWETGRIKLKDKKGGDFAEWPEHLRVREFPATPAEVAHS